jgi:gluconolactonase
LKRFKETDEVFFVQNAGAKNASTGLKKSAIIEKISLSQAATVSDKTDAVGLVDVTTVSSLPTVLNPNGKRNPPQRSLSLKLKRSSLLDL